ncbi:hypothetical protein BRADI_1g54765v3 [Brachypodium distachyon]|uniref:F-box domain-containing protein n=1 Tax=Brachypodium distachyon TaxID=15368 RepID=A0A0Q3HD80_BRADI|nr:hypothetical protein BRADI_1g54765v3 [Brachypodium distachyon]
MAPPTPTKQAEEDLAAASSFCALPCDVVREILLRLPAKELCRLRAVCLSWCSLTSDPSFIKDHAARHRRPYLASTFVSDLGDEKKAINIVELSSGDVIKRIQTSQRDFRLQRTQLDLFCLVGGRHPYPATGATLRNSHVISKEHKGYLKGGDNISIESCAFGKVPLTGEYKALRFLSVRSSNSVTQLYEVTTLDGSGHARWKAMPVPPVPVLLSHKMKSVVIDGVVYFLYDFLNPFYEHLRKTTKPGSIASFNLGTEEWMATLISGPEAVTTFYGDAYFGSNMGIYLNPPHVEDLSITNLNGSLVMVHIVSDDSMDLWFLVDFEKGLWVKKCSLSSRYENRFVYPLAVLDDERIIFIVQPTGMVQSYDPKTGTYTDMLEIADYRSICIYTGSLLH